MLLESGPQRIVGHSLASSISEEAPDWTPQLVPDLEALATRASDEIAAFAPAHT